MRQARALHLPNEALYMEEIKFWLQDLQEHAMFIRRGLSPDNADFSDAAQEFQRAFSVVLQKTEKLKSLKQMKLVIDEAVEIIREFQKFQRKILSDLLCGRKHGCIFPLLIDHMIRQAQYFLDLLEKLKAEKEYKTVSYTRELVIWLRFLADHTKLIDQAIDPSERRMRKIADDFSELFERLGSEARDWASMLYGHKETVSAFERFIMDVRVDVQRLRDFSKMVEDLAADCRLLGLMSMEMATHLRRESEHCLVVLTCLEKGVFKQEPASFCDDVADEVWQENDRQETVDDGFVNPPPDSELLDDGGTYRESAPVESALPEPDEPLPESAAAVAGELHIADQAIVQLPVDQIDAPIWIMPEEQLCHQEALPQVQPETLYKKAGEQHRRPVNFSGTSPGDRYGKAKRQSALPRPLGKTKQ